MNAVERIFEIAKQKHIPISKIERLCGFSNGCLGGLRKGNVPEDRLQKIAAVLETPVEYLRSGEITEQSYYTDKETAKIMQKLLESPGKHALAKAIADMTEEQAKIFADFVEGITRIDNYKNNQDA